MVLLQEWLFVLMIILFLNIEEGEEKLKTIRKKREVKRLFQFSGFFSAVMRSMASLAASCSGFMQAQIGSRESLLQYRDCPAKRQCQT